ncbi:MAG: ABC transporter permease subunit, partial [Planctomycetia bacterium]
MSATWRRTIAALVLDTFRQASSSGLTAALVVSTLLATAACLSLTARTVTTPPPVGAPVGSPSATHGEIGLAGAGWSMRLGADAAEAERTAPALVAGVAANGAGVLLALAWTAGFLPNFVQPQSVFVLLAKPPRRRGLLVGKVAGAVAVVAAYGGIFIAATWVAFGLRTGRWDAGYLLAIPMLALNFFLFYSMSALVGVFLRSTAASIIGSIFFYAVCVGMNAGQRFASEALSDKPGAVAAPMLRATEFCYWLLPKPVDLQFLLWQALDAPEAGVVKAPLLVVATS